MKPYPVCLILHVSILDASFLWKNLTVSDSIVNGLCSFDFFFVLFA